MIALLTVFAWNRATAELPEPLSLNAALEIAISNHYELRAAEARYERAHASEEVSIAERDLELRLEGRLRRVEPNENSLIRERDDSALGLVLRKPLYDFGRSDLRIQARAEQSEARRWGVVEARHSLRLEVMERFFAILLADLRFARDDEAMAIAYIRFENAQERYDLGELADIELLKVESRYQVARSRRLGSEQAQRRSRAALAEAIGRPGELPSQLDSDLDLQLDREVPSYDELLAQAIAANPTLQRLDSARAAAQTELRAARRFSWPTLIGEAGVFDYQRLSGNNHDWQIGVELNAPLYLGGRAPAQIDRAGAELKLAEAAYQRALAQLRQQLLERIQDLRLLKVEREAALIEGDYRELALDRSRSLYELEMRTNLGDAMVDSSAAQLELRRAELNWALTWGEIDALLGRAPGTPADYVPGSD